jgi:hemerythrin
MSNVTWNKSMSVNVKILDKQHKALVATINKANKLLINNANKSDISIVLKELIDYVYKHFETEEKYFQEFNYPKAKEHINQHNKFAYKVAKFQEDYLNNKTDFTQSLIDYLDTWIKEHVQDLDQKYSKFFNDHGLF